MQVKKNEPHNNIPRLQTSLFTLRYLSTWIGMGLLYVLTVTPIRLQLALGSMLGSILINFSPQRKKIAEINLRLCFSDKTDEEISKMLNETFKDLGRGLFETGIAWWRSDNFVDNLITKSNNLELLDKETEGVLILIKHSTHLELDVRIISRRLKIGGMYKIQKNGVMNYLMTRGRNNYVTGAVTNLQTKRGLVWLKKGLKFLYAADQDYGGKVSDFVPFFGIKTATVKLPGELCEKGTRVLFANVMRVKSGYEISLEDLGINENKKDFLKKMNAYYEASILKTPTQYLWMHRRFKTRPEEEANIYPYWKRREERRERNRKKRI